MLIVLIKIRFKTEAAKAIQRCDINKQVQNDQHTSPQHQITGEISLQHKDKDDKINVQHTNDGDEEIFFVSYHNSSFNKTRSLCSPDNSPSKKGSSFKTEIKENF